VFVTSRSISELLLPFFSSVLLIGCVLGATSSNAQAERTGNVVYGKLGIGLSDYTGDWGTSSFGEAHSHPFDFQEPLKGVPFYLSGEVGYALSPQFAIGLGIQGGNYPLADATFENGTGQFRATSQLLGRYTFQAREWTVAPYLEGGLALTFGGAQIGIGPSLGMGLNVQLSSSTSLYLESRFNMAFPDEAVDGRSDDIGPTDPGNPEKPLPISDVPFDLTNQLFGVGIKTNIDLNADIDLLSGDESSEGNEGNAIPTGSLSSSSTSTEADPDTTDEDSRYEDMSLIPDGTYIIGLTDEDPLSLQTAGRKRVTISAFHLDKYEVTNADYREYLDELSADERQARLPDSTVWGRARSQESWTAYFRGELFSDHPVVGVTWRDARAYCQANNKRLPTEAEWEYAARGGHLGRVYPWPGLGTQNEEGDYLANYNPNEGYAFDGYAFTAPVDALPPNDWGLYNMAGNVAEWTRDAYNPSYENISDFNPRYEDEEESRRVVRGGAWNSSAFFIGVGVRNTQPRDEASTSIGFRCVREVSSAQPDESPDSTSGASSREEDSSE
jgi:formylglycine-generating enzyme required for sulfatase activity